jgi:TrpR family trp operon transcriptional repressor
MTKNKTKPGISGIKGIIKTLCRIDSPREMESFLREILTLREYHDLALRWELMRRLEEGHTQRQIAFDLKISLCKITRGSKILKKSGSVTKRYLSQRRKK